VTGPQPGVQLNIVDTAVSNVQLNVVDTAVSDVQMMVVDTAVGDPREHVVGEAASEMLLSVIDTAVGKSHTPRQQNMDLGLDRIDHQRMTEWQAATSPFTASSYCNPFCSLPTVSFESVDCKHMHVWIDPPPNRLASALQHYAQCKAAAPRTTSACILVPRHEGGSDWRRHLHGMRLLCEIPAGTALKFTCAKPGTAATAHSPATPAVLPMPVKPSAVPLQVWFDPQAGCDANNLAGQIIQAYYPADSGPRKVTQHTLKAASPGEWMVFTACIGARICRVLLDTGASANFISKDLAEQIKAPIVAGKDLPVQTAGGQVEVLGVCHARLQLQDHSSSPRFLVLPTLLQDFDAILGRPWLQQHAVHMHCETSSCTIRHKGKRLTIAGGDADAVARAVQLASEQIPEQATEPDPELPASDGEPPAKPHVLSAKRFYREMQSANSRLFLINIKAAVVDHIETSRANAMATAVPTCSDPAAVPTWVYPAAVPTGVYPAEVQGTKSSVPAALQAVLDSFKGVFEEIPAGLPPERLQPHTIPLLPDAQIPHKRMYRLSPREREEVEKQVAWLLAKGWISESSSPFGSPVLFVIKPNGEYRMCVDFRAVNKICVKNRYPLPRIDDLLDRLHGATVFSSLDLQMGYHQLRISPEDRPKTAFLTHLGLYEYNVLCFGLCNAPASFMTIMNRVFTGCSSFVLVYMDDICVFSKTMEEHVGHLKEVLQRLKDAQLYAKLSKCQFGTRVAKFLGFIISEEGIAVDPKKVATMLAWPTPSTVEEVRAFVGLATFFRKHIQDFSDIAYPLHKLFRKEAVWNWSAECQTAFVTLKSKLATAPVLAAPDLAPDAEPFKVYCDASLIGVGAVLTQGGRPVAFESRRMLPAECNYTTTEQELLAVVHALRTWRCYLEGVKSVVVTDHSPLLYLQTKQSLSRRQVRWVGELQNYDFSWEHMPGKLNPADPLSRLMALFGASCSLMHALSTEQEHAQQARTRTRTQHVLSAITRRQQKALQAATPPAHPPAEAVDPTQPTAPVADRQASQPLETAPQPEKAPDPQPLSKPRAVITLTDLQAKCKRGYAVDAWFAEKPNLADLELTSVGIWTYKGKTVVPDAPSLRADIMHEVHDTPYGGHLGVQRTYEMLSRMFWWSSMRTDVRDYVLTCSSCQRNKASRLLPAGLLQSLQIPSRRWESVSLDFITQLPLTTSGNTQIVVYVDRLTKMVHLEALPENADTLRVAKSFVHNVFRLHGLPMHLVSDRDTKFTSGVWQEVMKQVGTKLGMTTAYHAQGDGQTERMNQVLEDMIRVWVGPNQDDWDSLLDVAEFAINNGLSASVKDTPFRLNHGQDPLTPLSIQAAVKHPAAGNFVGRMRDTLISAKLALQQAQARQQKSYDARHRPQSFEVGDMVLLKSTNLIWKGKVSRKLMPKYVGPYKVSATAGAVSYRLELPQQMKIHPVFHTSLLKPWKPSERHQPQPAAVLIEGAEEWEVETILSHVLPAKRAGKQPPTKYLVRWKGFGPELDELLTADMLANSPVLMQEYWDRHPEKKGERV